MATLESLFPFTGRIGDLCAYRRKDTGKIVIRRAGGPSRRQIRTGPSFDRTRRNISEFGGAVQMTKLFRRAFRPLLPVADSNFTGRLNAFFRSFSALDGKSEFGKRSILLSENPRLLEGLAFNKFVLFESVFQSILSVTFVNENGGLHITFPAAISKINFLTEQGFPFYRFEAAVAILPDVAFIKNGYHPLMDASESIAGSWKCSQWFSTSEGSEEISIDLSMGDHAEVSGTMVVCVAIRFGEANQATAVRPVKGGCGKVLVAASVGEH